MGRQGFVERCGSRLPVAGVHIGKTELGYEVIELGAGVIDRGREGGDFGLYVIKTCKISRCLMGLLARDSTTIV
jgi:hypothetical protein